MSTPQSTKSSLWVNRLQRLADAVLPLLLILWVGASLFFSFVVAPSSFSVLRGFALPNANQIAGTIVARNLSFINMSGLALGLVALVFLATRLKEKRTRAFYLEAGALMLLTAFSAIGQWVSTRMSLLRLSMGEPIDGVPTDDPLRVAFNWWHTFSEMSLVIAILGATIAAYLISRRRFS